jgi:ABC-type sugar transport system permease subunit
LNAATSPSPEGSIQIVKRRGISDDALKRILLAPTVIIIVGLVIYPFAWAVYLSFSDIHHQTG